MVSITVEPTRTGLKADKSQMNRRDAAIFLHGLTGGGAERVMVTIANGLADRGYGIDLVLAEKADGPFANLVSSNVRVVELGCHHVRQSVPQLTSYIRRERPRALLSGLNYPNIVAALARRVAGQDTRLIASAHSCIIPSLPHIGFAKRAVLPILMRRAFRSADIVVCVSRGVSDDVARITGLPTERRPVIYNPVDLSAVTAMASEPLNHPWAQPCQPPIIVASGRFVRAKQFDVLLEAFAAIRSRYRCRLVLLGDGPERTALERATSLLGIADDVYMPGFVANPFPWMRRADAFVLSSAWEGLGLVLVEALACGAPVVSTDCPGGPREILEDGRWGRLVPVGDPDAMAHGVVLTLMAGGPDGRSRAAAFATQRALDEYEDVLGLRSYTPNHARVAA